MAAFPPIEQLLPHRGSMLLTDAVLSYEPDSIVTRATAAPEGMPAWMGLELMAQAAAALAGMEARARNQALRRGMLIGCRTFRAASPSLSGALSVKATRTASDPSGFSLFDCSVTGPTGASLVTGTIQVLLQ